MSTDQSLLSLPISSLLQGEKLISEAHAAGMAPEQVDKIIAHELGHYGSPSMTWFKARVSGTMAAPVFALFGLGGWWAGHLIPAQAALFLAMACLAWWLRSFGAKNERFSAFAAATLRAHAHALSPDEISVLKDDPRLVGDPDARRLLEDIRKSSPA